ncbi:Vps38p KNAG_0B05850 [Huiozyma naganishii CBS 8797]|uniref:Uncharacterized protein n=1 Tax=Huiozyma naganishii (strain ATCC MYA-139 / BCRC 22969 / CBS 8797 / KCTC 17520 / NBRC 10181 / NCYC 3082 / Yp74L-3) TaxID=1071383 RepID=J7S599_HUIN7|nr:hypothetical protein KNAG_0B05850 [Kazachstania naganishii CBS 8797]CCK69016.1 hypothetical protein KNAG_0B05850 [Kazachstania naganishii CBS 8797]
MTGYLLQRRLRHLQCITVVNAALLLLRPNLEGPENKTLEVIRCVPCFYTLETAKGQLVYVSEVQSSVLNNVPFNEVRFTGDSTMHLTLKVIARVPNETLQDGCNETVWAVAATYHVDLNHLVEVELDVMSVQDYNAPIMKMTDGTFTLRSVKTQRTSPLIMGNAYTNPVKASPINIVKSFSYNQMLKLNKILEYRDNVYGERSTISQRLEENINRHRRHSRIHLSKERAFNSIRELENSLDIKQRRLRELSRLLSANEISKVDSSFEDPIWHDQYATLYSNLIQTRARLFNLRKRKIHQIVTVFGSLINLKFGLIDCRNNQLKLNTVDFGLLMEVIMSSPSPEACRMEINIALGYYLLLVSLLSSTALAVDLPHILFYCGSNSVVDCKYPFYISDAQSQKQMKKFQDGVLSFNVNVLQIRQFLD